MALRSMTIFLVSFLLLPMSAVLAEEKASSEAADLFVKGGALLQGGDIEGAMNAYMAAAKAEPGNKEYADKAMLIRRVVAIRRYVASSEVSPKWEKMVLSLHSFYLRNRIHEEALALDRITHEKLKSALSASLLVETLLEMGRDAEALAVLKSLDKKSLDLQNRLYLGIALARLDRVDEAHDLRKRLRVPENSGAGILYDVARFDSLLGRRTEAVETLRLCFEKTPPSNLALVKGFVKECADFKPLLASPEFAKVLKTQSKIKESDCSGGTSCGTCPKKSGCSTSTKESGGK